MSNTYSPEGANEKNLKRKLTLVGDGVELSVGELVTVVGFLWYNEKQIVKQAVVRVMANIFNHHYPNELQ